MTKTEFENLKVNDKVYCVDRKGCCVYTGKVDSIHYEPLICIKNLHKIINDTEVEVSFSIGTDYKYVYTSKEKAMQIIKKLKVNP